MTDKNPFDVCVSLSICVLSLSSLIVLIDEALHDIFAIDV